MHSYWGIWSDVALVLVGLSGLVLAVGSVWLRARRLTLEEQRRRNDVEVDRLERIERIVEASAIEVERLGEAQRMTTRLLGDRLAPPMPDPVPPRVITPH